MSDDFVIYANEIAEMAAGVQAAWQQEDELNNYRYSSEDYQAAVHKWLAQQVQVWLDWPNEYMGTDVHNLLVHDFGNRPQPGENDII